MLVKVRVLQAFSSPRARHAPGDVVDVLPVEADAWTRKGLVEPVAPAAEVQTATLPEAPETAVLRRRRGGR